MKHLKLFFALFAMLALGVTNAWGANSGITASDGVFVIDFYNSEKLASTSGSDLTTSNYSDFVKVASGLTKSNVVTSIAKDGTVQYNKNGGLTIGSSKVNAHYVTFNIGSDYAVNKITVYATQYESGRLLLNGKAADSGKLGTKGCQFSSVTQPLVWDDLNGATTLKFTKDNGSGSTQKRLTIYTIVCEYTTSGGGSTEPVLSATPTEIDFGTVYQGTTVEDKTVAVNFENLTGNVTYSGLSTPFTATGAITTTGDKITISADASTIGEYSQTLTIASTADSKTAEVTVKMNVVEKPAPTGTFTLHTGELIEGDYVIVSTNSLKAEVNSDRLASLPVTISNDEIVDPDATTIWHIAKSGEYWTLYNANKAKYAASTGAKNKAALLDDGSDDKALWSVTGTSTYEFVNKKNTAAAVNANLRYNSQNAENSRWACYSTSTGAALSLYRKAGTKYNVNISATTKGTVTADPTSAEAGTTITLTVTPETGYVLDALTVTDASSNPVTVTDNKFTMPAADVTIAATFKENEKPAATLTLSKNGEPEDITGNKQDDVVTLPTTITNDCVKKFVGWSTEVIEEPLQEKPISNFYEPGADYTLAALAQTLYAVYATVGAGGEATAANTLSSNGWANESKHTSLQIDENVKAEITGTGLSNSGKYYTSGTNWRLYQNENPNLTISTTIGELKSVKFTFTSEKTGTLLYNGTKLTSGTAVSVSGTSAIFTVGNSTASVTNGQIRISKIEVVYTGGVSYSNYSTTCAAALANPTFSLAAGKYTEAKSVEITATEGTVYYTTDGTTPTASSTPYTGAIALNDCGEYTIKAIAISADSQSDVVSATYTIKLPLTNSQAAPYTEAEAIAVYDGDCYDNQDVYVKGTVKTATFYNSGTYTITLTNGFRFYKFYKSASKELFTDGAINAGDVLVACGKLSKYNTTYQLAEGCYLVEHEPYTEPKTDISNTEATAYTVDQAFALIADVSSDLTKEVFVKGLVAVAPTSNPTTDGQMTYKISDNGENTGNVLTVYLGLNLNGEKFTSKNDVQQGDYVVVKGKLLDYNSTYELNKGNQLVQHVKAATITIADITMEVGETKTIAATVVPAEAEVTYTIKENAANAISLSGNTITANAVGTATITATIAEGATYMGNSVDFTVTVGPKSEKTNVVILAEYKDKWYALVAAKGSANNTLGAVEVTYVNGVILDFDGDKASITWERAIVGNKATFKNGTNYVKGATGDTNLTLETSAFEWEVVDGKYLVESKRTFLYNKAGYFKNYDANTNAGKADYSAWPVVTAVEFMNSVTTPSVEKGIFSVGNGKFVQFSAGNLQYNVGTNTWSFAANQYDYVGEANINIGDPNYEGKIDMFGWSTDDENNNYGVNPNNINELYDGTFQDWGTLVNEEDWYTLSADEWKYLLNTRANAANLKQIAKVNNGEKDIVGIMLFPDAWAMPADVNVAAAYDDYFKVNIYNYTLEQWQKLEAVGAVFLPAAGRRTGGYGNMINYDQQVETREDYLVNGGFYRWQDNTNIYCYYWTSTINESTNDVSYLHNIQALGGDEYTIGTGAVWGEKGRYGQSVRLVKAIEPDYKREVRQGYYGTICLENGGQMIGASLFGLSYYNEAQGLLYMDEADATMVAGNPYIFLPNEGANTLYVFYDETTPATEAGTVNGLVGSYTKEPLAVDATNPNYILKDNKIKKVVGTGVSVGANKAYIKLGDVDKNEPALVPGRRRVAIGQAPQVATGMESADASAQPVKMIIDGQLYILRGEKMYDAQGKLVK